MDIDLEEFSDSAKIILRCMTYSVHFRPSSSCCRMDDWAGGRVRGQLLVMDEVVDGRRPIVDVSRGRRAGLRSFARGADVRLPYPVHAAFVGELPVKN